LELAAFIMTQELTNKKQRKATFKMNRFRVEEKDERLFFIVSASGSGSGSGSAKDMSHDTCMKYNSIFNTEYFTKLPSEMWPGLSTADYALLSKEVVFSTELISKENTQFKIQCS